VLSTLKSAGLPFEAPDQPEAIYITTFVAADGSVYVRYDPPAPATVADAIMPELAGMKVRVDNDMPAGTIGFVDSVTGAEVGRIENVRAD
jgi:hypothetical protein